MIKPLASNFRHGIAFAAAAALSALALSSTAPAIAASPAQDEDRLSYVLIGPGGENSTMSGSMEELHRAQSLRAGAEGLLYVRQGGVGYVIRDAATLRRANAIMEPQRVLGARQGELGARQGELGRRQGQLGAEQGKLGRQMADAAPRRAAALGREMSELGRQQGALGAQQSVLGRQQAELGREQARLGQIAQGQIRALVAEAIRRGVAQRVD